MAKNKKLKLAQKADDNSQNRAQIAIAHQGPLPMATEFAAYEKVLPGSADRIITMAEKSLESEIADMRAERRADLFALVSGRAFLYLLLGVSVFLIIAGHPIAALLAGLAPIVSVIYGTFKSTRKEKS